MAEMLCRAVGITLWVVQGSSYLVAAKLSSGYRDKIYGQVASAGPSMGEST